MATNRGNRAPNPAAMPPRNVLTEAPALPPPPTPGITGVQLMTNAPSRPVKRLCSFRNNRVGRLGNQWSDPNRVNVQQAVDHPGPGNIQQHPGPGNIQQHPGPFNIQQHPGPGNIQQHPGPGNIQQHPGPGLFNAQQPVANELPGVVADGDPIIG